MSFIVRSFVRGIRSNNTFTRSTFQRGAHRVMKVPNSKNNTSKRIDDLRDDMNRRYDGMDKKLDDVKGDISKKFDDVHKKVDKLGDDINKKFDNVDKKFDNIDKKFDNIDKKFDNVDKKFDKLGENVDKLRDKLVKLPYILPTSVFTALVGGVSLLGYAGWNVDVNFKPKETTKETEEN